jgi:hypothetical protein
MLQRNLLYTGVTRGKRLVVLVGQKNASLGDAQRQIGKSVDISNLDLERSRQRLPQPENQNPSLRHRRSGNQSSLKRYPTPYRVSIMSNAASADRKRLRSRLI